MILFCQGQEEKMRLYITQVDLLALALVCLFRMPLLVNGLKCHCDICTQSNHTCVTDGYCFASTSLDHDVITHAYRRGCYDRKGWFPPERPLKAVDSIAYCDETNYCNINLKLRSAGIKQP